MLSQVLAARSFIQRGLSGRLVTKRGEGKRKLTTEAYESGGVTSIGPIHQQRTLLGVRFSRLETGGVLSSKLIRSVQRSTDSKRHSSPVGERGGVVLLVEDIHVESVREVVHQDVDIQRLGPNHAVRGAHRLYITGLIKYWRVT